MKHDLTSYIKLFNGKNLHERVDDGSGQPVESSITLGKFLTMVCLNANAKTVDEKYKLYKLCQKIHKGEESKQPTDITAEEVVILKKHMGEGPYAIIAVGAVVDVLEGG